MKPAVVDRAAAPSDLRVGVRVFRPCVRAAELGSDRGMSESTVTSLSDRRSRRAAALRAGRARALADLADRRAKLDAGHSVMYRREAIRLRAMAAEWEYTAGISALSVG